MDKRGLYQDVHCGKVMEWAGIVSLGLKVLAILALIFVGARILKAFKAEHQQEAIKDESKKVVNAEKDLADNLNKPSESHFPVSKPDAWKKPPPKA